MRDARLREHDALLGVVTLPLGELFKTQSQVTRLFSIQEGVGFGRINMSLLFKGVSVELSPSMRGWETGTVQVLSDIRGTGLDASFASRQLVLRTTDDVERIPRSAARQDGSDIIWALGKGEENVERRLPIYNRYASALVFDIGGTKPNAIAVLWLQDIVDDEEQEVELDIMEGKDLDKLSQCYVSEHTKILYVYCSLLFPRVSWLNVTLRHPYDIIGKLHFTVRFDRGLDGEHAKLATDQKKQHTYDTYMAAEGMNTQLAEARAGRGEDDPKTKREKKLEKQDLHRRGRGVMQIKPVRSEYPLHCRLQCQYFLCRPLAVKWMGDSLKNKTQTIKGKLMPSLNGQQRTSFYSYCV